DGFVYETEFGYARYDFKYPSEKDLENVEFGGSFRKYNGQKKLGSGQIEKPNDYIKDRYGLGYRVNNEVILSGFQNVIQNDYSIYWNRKTQTGEGNCALSSMFGVMRYFRDYKSTKKLPYGNIVINPENDYFYNSVIRDYYINENIKNNIPKIYARIRENAKKYGYTTEASILSSLNMANIFTNTMRDFGYKTKIFQKYANMVLFWSFWSQVKTEIDAGYPTIWNPIISQYGQPHSLVVKGYRQYYKEKSFWFFNWREYKNLMVVSDNWDKKDLYFDLTAFGKFERLGVFLKVRNHAYY
ncbi:MAG: C10 family peptidase, partial [Malacoplasma sp.]|nr:C10 family peptidase [Malacoplasma sp.]MDE6894403.1 C10 family peptidase [Malacoplasma sp.]MDE7075580.1 C10 family peptidase [Malacoplasma sp.]